MRTALVVLLLAACAGARSKETHMNVEQQLIAAEEAVFAAIAGRDQVALTALLADDFVLRVPGQPDVDRAGFLAAIAEIPGEILSVSGEDVRAQLLPGGTGMVSGLQLARVRIEGQEILDRGSFVDLFEQQGGRWVMTWAFSIPTPAP